MSQNQYKSEWKQVDSLQNIGQSQTALDIVIRIYDQSKARNQADQFVKASLMRMSLESDFQEDYLIQSIKRTLLEAQTAKAPIKQILHSMAAELYWNYYQNNRWKILGRSEVSNFATDDISTWDLKKLVTACMENYTLSLTEKDLLIKTPLTAFTEVLIKQENSEKFRPTLFDFLAYRAIDFYSGSESGLTKPAASFLLNTPAYFLSSSEFASISILSNDVFSFDYQVLKLYQEIIGFHLPDADPVALIDAELQRLAFVYEKSILPEKESLYLAALTKLEKQFLQHPSSTEISYKIASLLNNENLQESLLGDYAQDVKPVPEARKWDKKRAVEVCEAAIKRFPDSFGAKNCKALIAEIKTPSLQLTTDFASTASKPSLALVNYKNASKLYFRLSKIDPETDRNLQNINYEERREKYLSLKPDKTWSQAMPDDGDFNNHSSEISIPSLSTGYYAMLASNDARFATDNTIVLNTFWKTNISYISRRNDDGINQIAVLNRETGQPLAGVTVKVYYRDYNSRIRNYENVAGGTYLSDKTGIVTIPANNGKRNNNQFFLVFTTKSDKLTTESYFSDYSYVRDDQKSITTTNFFTDRAIYRPGQTLFFKGIVLEKTGEEVKIKPKHKTEITFYDVNVQVISKQTLITNDFGSFSGNFAIPQGLLTGSMRIQNESGNTYIKVEEYKRPKFEVTFDPVKGSYKLDETIVAKGKAIAYAGSSISDAKVKYRVVRQARFPYWWSWRSMPSSPEMEITNGETLTGNDGSFSVSFKAIPDLAVDPKNDPVFTYTVYAEVTDINGESHNSEAAITVGYKALLVKTNIEEDINLENKLRFSLSTTNLNGENENASGTITIAKLIKPKQVLFARKWARPDRFAMTKAEFTKLFPGEVYNDEDDVSTWIKEKIVFTKAFKTPADSSILVDNSLQPGMYVVEIQTKDAFGKDVLYKKYCNAFQPNANTTETVSPFFFTLLTPTAEPGDEVTFIVGTPLKKAYIIYDILHKGTIISRSFLNLSEEQKLIRIPVKEEYRGNFAISLAFVKNNRAFLLNKLITVPYTNKKLNINFATFRSKLQPGQAEEWQITLKDSKGEKTIAEMLAGMYDASLDAFEPHNWSFNIYNSYFGVNSWNQNQYFGTRPGSELIIHENTSVFVFHDYDALNWFGFQMGNSYGMMRHMMKSGQALEYSQDAMAAPAIVADSNEETISVRGVVSNNGSGLHSQDLKTKPETLPVIQIRKDFNETAFFFSQLATNEKGEIIIKFKAPEALTRWKMMGLAHTKDLKYGLIEKTLVTQKDLMLFTNAPRFMREGDKMDFAAKISNISDRSLSGTAELHFFDAYTMKPIDDLMGIKQTAIPFTVNQGLSSPLSWKVSIPDGIQAVIYRITATSGAFSDGEEAAIPVLTNRMLVTESMPLPINGLQQKKFNFEKLINSGKAGSTMRNYRLSLEYTSNPAWYAVQALPYLMEYPYECAESIFSRYYANSLATHIVNSDPKIKRIFESWKNITPDALKSNLEKNEELKSVLLQESPWVREATNESERKQRIALLFDLNRMATEQNAALKKLNEMQNPNGGWPWFPGMPESRYISQHIVTGLGHLYYLEVLNPSANSTYSEMLKKAIEFLDETVKIDFEKTKKNDKDYLKNNHLGYDDIQYLYARTYFLADYPLRPEYNEMVEYYKNQSVTYWKSNNNYMRAMIALFLNRFKDEKTASLIMRSLKETALHNDEMGMYWRNEQRGWFWYQAPVETQALMIEAFDEIGNDQKSVEEMKIWLLKQKQTQDWKTSKATTEAIYALLLRGTSLLASDKQVEISLGNEKINPYPLDGSKPEAGTGYFKTSWDATAIKPEMGKITVNNPNPTVAWGALYWQYFEQLDKITTAETPLKLNKKLFREVNTPTGPVIEPITPNSPVKVGDKIVVRVELRSDRDMEYIHLKDMRASAFEPVNILSGYRYQDGLGYYESTRDASTNFFISYLPKGTYVFEYKLTATQKGEFSNGITSVQCMYAPEFAAHSEGIRVKVE